MRGHYYSTRDVQKIYKTTSGLDESKLPLSINVNSILTDNKYITCQTPKTTKNEAETKRIDLHLEEENIVDDEEYEENAIEDEQKF